MFPLSATPAPPPAPGIWGYDLGGEEDHRVPVEAAGPRGAGRTTSAETERQGGDERGEGFGQLVGARMGDYGGGGGGSKGPTTNFIH